MDPRKRDEPSLDNILSRDFAELGAGEANMKPTNAEEKTVLEDEGEALSPVESPHPTAYNHVIDAVEDRTSFTVNTPPGKGADKTKSTEGPSSSNTTVTVLSEPTTGLGDDFDVEW